MPPDSRKPSSSQQSESSARAQPLVAPEPSSPIVSKRCVCPECGHVFQGNGWDGIDAHWKAKHEKVMPYAEAWPLIRSGDYGRSTHLADAIAAQEANMAGVDAKNAMDRRKSARYTRDAISKHHKASDAIGEMAGLINEIDVDPVDVRAQMSQSEKFTQAARDLGTDESEDAFRGVLRKLTKPKG